MTLEQAKQCAQERWPALGGWAEEECILEGDHARWERRVGYRTNHGHGAQKVQMGMGKTWEKAFQSADKHEATITRRLENHYR